MCRRRRQGTACGPSHRDCHRSSCPDLMKYWPASTSPWRQDLRVVGVRNGREPRGWPGQPASCVLLEVSAGSAFPGVLEPLVPRRLAGVTVLGALPLPWRGVAFLHLLSDYRRGLLGSLRKLKGWGGAQPFSPLGPSQGGQCPRWGHQRLTALQLVFLSVLRP